MATIGLSPATFDEDTAQAVQVLALAVQRERVPGIVEFGTASDALTRAVSSRSRTDLEYAAVAFGSLDPGYRTRVVERAYDLARSERSRLRMPQIPQPTRARPEASAALEEPMARGDNRTHRRPRDDHGRTTAAGSEPAIHEDDLVPTLDEIVPFQLGRPDGPPKRWK